MNIAKKEKMHLQLRQKYDEKVEIYLEKFGEHSLDNVFFVGTSRLPNLLEKLFGVSYWRPPKSNRQRRPD
ncbi:TPA: hypothetical protein ACGORW_001548 [Streptococcus suis]